MPVKIFFCYAHEDEALLNKLKTHLRPLQRQGLIDVWYDRDINAGAEWKREISEQLNTAQIILLLISPDFMDSDYCYSIQMKRALERHAHGEALVIPVILRPVHWQDILGNIQTLPTDAKPVMSSSWHSPEEAFFNVAEGVRKSIDQLTTKSKINQIPTLPKTPQMPITNSSLMFNAASKQQSILANMNSLRQSQLKSISSPSPSVSTLNRLGKWTIQGRNLFLILSMLDIIFLLLSFFLSPNSPLSVISIVVAAGIFTFSLIESALFQQWYWFVGILLLNPLTGFIYYQVDLAPLAIRWYWFIGSILLSPLIGAGYSLFGPKQKPRYPISNTAFKQLILTTSFVGIIVFIIAAVFNSVWTVYIGLDFYLVGYILAIIQVVRLKQGYWIEEHLVELFLFMIPILFFGIVYAIFGPKTEES